MESNTRKPIAYSGLLRLRAVTPAALTRVVPRAAEEFFLFAPSAGVDSSRAYIDHDHIRYHLSHMAVDRLQLASCHATHPLYLLAFRINWMRVA